MARFRVAVPLIPAVVSVVSAQNSLQSDPPKEKEKNPMQSRTLVSAAVLLLTTLLSALAFGQNDRVPTFSVIENHGVDAINLQNLDILINPPVRDKTGAIPFPFAMVGNSSCDLVTNGQGTDTGLFCGITLSKGFLNPGALGVTTYLTETTTLLFTSARATSTQMTCPDGSATTKYTNWIVYDSAGTSHSLPVTDYVDSKQCLAASFTDYPRDNSGCRWHLGERQSRIRLQRANGSGFDDSHPASSQGKYC